MVADNAPPVARLVFLRFLIEVTASLVILGYFDNNEQLHGLNSLEFLRYSMTLLRNRYLITRLYSVHCCFCKSLV